MDLCIQKELQLHFVLTTLTLEAIHPLRRTDGSDDEDEPSGGTSTRRHGEHIKATVGTCYRSVKQERLAAQHHRRSSAGFYYIGIRAIVVNVKVRVNCHNFISKRFRSNNYHHLLPLVLHSL